MSYFGWPEEWYDKDGSPKVSELLIKCYANKYFDFPEDFDDDDQPLIMFFVKCYPYW